MKCLCQMFTGKDNATWDLARVLWAKTVIAFIGLSMLHIWRGGAFDPVAWGTGAGLVLAAGGAAVAVKAHTEPTA